MAIQNKTALLLEKQAIVIINPSKPIPHDSLTLSTIDNNPTLDLLCQTLYVYKPNPSISADPVALLKTALADALVHYHPLAGKLNRSAHDGLLRISFPGDGVGVPFLEATARCTLREVEYFDGTDDVEIAKRFVFDYPGDDDGYHPLVLQVTRFGCGGFTVGMGLSHSVCDGFGAAQLFGAVAELASGRGEPSVKPVWERERLIGKVSDNYQLPKPPIDETSSATSPYLPTDNLSHRSFHVTTDHISNLKNSVTPETFTVVELLGAYIWRARFKALKLNSDAKTLFCLSIGIRNRYALPEGYYGNAFVASHVVLSGRDLAGWPLAAVARRIRERKEEDSGAEHIREQLDALEALRRVGVRMGGSGGASMVLTDWRRMGLTEAADFGWGAAVNMVPLPWDMLGYVDLCIFMNPSSLVRSGGVRVLVCLPTAAMGVFEREMEALGDVGCGNR